MKVLLLLAMLQLAEPYETPEKYYAWWNDVIECSGYDVSEAALDSIEFWHVNRSSFIADGHPGHVGYAYVKENEIFVIRALKNDEVTIKHEMLHFILWWRKEGYEGGHPEEFEICNLLESPLWGWDMWGMPFIDFFVIPMM